MKALNNNDRIKQSKSPRIEMGKHDIERVCPSLRLVTFLSVLLAFVFVLPSLSAAITSDDFHASTLDAGLWTFIDPAGDGAVDMSGTQLLLSVPSGVSHDVWSSGNYAPRVMQAADDADFEIEVKFESAVSEQYQLQGVLVEQDGGNFLRFDFYSDGSDTRIFAASFTNGSPSARGNNVIAAAGSALYMRITREGDQWTQWYSDDGVSWSTGAAFSFPMSVSSVGVFTGNAGGNPAHTAVVDYFFNTASPIDPEDDGEAVLMVDVNGSGSVTADPDQSAYDIGQSVSLTAAPDAGYVFSGWSGDISGSENPVTLTMDADKFVTANFMEDAVVYYDLSVVVSGSGTVTLDPPGGAYAEGTVVTLTATPDTGATFEGWTGDLTGMENPAAVTVNSAMTIMGSFSTVEDVTAPTISNVSVSTAGSGATITWQTDESALGNVTYGQSDAYEIGTVSETASGTAHSVSLMGLAAETVYYFQVTATDAGGNTAYSDGWSFITASDPSGIISDDFHAYTLDSSIWTLIDPRGDAGLNLNGSQAILSVPSGVVHDVWTSGNTAPRIMQPANDTDFEVEVKFESALSLAYQIQGILVEQDSGQFLRFDFYSDGSNTKVFAAEFVGGSPAVQVDDSIINNDPPYYLRVRRHGDQWSQFYSSDGATWQKAVEFSFPMVVNSVGVFVGNAGSAPSHSGVVDYFFNSASPIDGEDEGELPPPPEFVLDWSVTGPGRILADPDQSTYEYGQEVTLTAEPDPGYYFSGWSGDISGFQNPITITMDSDKVVGATFIDDTPQIDIWYGDSQEFGHLGVPQRWVNILGNVFDADGISSLTYSLNGGTDNPLSLGPDGLRLVAEGDFNIDIAIENLVVGYNEVEVVATDSYNNQSRRVVDFYFSDQNIWPESYSIDWSATASIQDVVQVVDGKWKLESDSVRVVEPGYDRLLAVGDMLWDDYEVTVKVRINAFVNGNWGSGVGLILRWDGHYDWDGSQPSHGWYPLGALGWYRDYDCECLRLEGGGTNLKQSDNSGFQMTPGLWYIFKMRVETTETGAIYSLKAWEDGTLEPANWHLTGEEGLSDPQSGSILFVAHNADASFGNLSIAPLE